MVTPKILFVYDRRKKASDTKKGSVELIVNYAGNRKIIATGVLLLPSEWSEKYKRCKGKDADHNNKILDDLLAKTRKLFEDRDGQGKPHISSLNEILRVKVEEITFLEFVEKRIYERRYSDKTREKIMYWYNFLKGYGKMVYFTDVTAPAIYEMDGWLHTQTKHQRINGKMKVVQKYCQGTIYNYHKNLCAFINDAVNFGHLQYNPYTRNQIRIPKGEKDHVDYLTYEQVEQIEKMKFVGYMDEVKDLFLLQCYTGTAYSDMYNINKGMCKKSEYGLIYSNKRVKTKVRFTILLREEAIRILDKYDWELPVICNQKYNEWLKIIGQMIGEPGLHSHQGRGAFATILINRGVPMEILQKTLGHSDIQMTQHYASMLDDTVAKTMASL